MASLFADDFNRADGALGANWTSLAAAGTIVSNQYAPAAADSLDYWNGGTPPADCYAQCAASAVVASTSYGGLILRVDTTLFNFYGCTWNTSGMRIQRFTAGVATNIDGGSLTAPTNGQVIRLTMVGTLLALYYDRVLISTATDATYSAAGRSGVLARGTTNRQDDFETGTLTAPPLISTFNPALLQM